MTFLRRLLRRPPATAQVDTPAEEASQSRPPHASPAEDQGADQSEEQVASWYVPRDGNDSRFIGPDGMPLLRLIRYLDSSGEVVLRLCETTTGLLVGPSDPRVAKAGVLVSQLRGEAYRLADCRAGDFSLGAPVQLVPEPDNIYDDRAVAVYDQTAQHKCGYMNKQKARAYLKRVAAGEHLNAISLRGTGAGISCEQVTVLAATADALRLLRQPMPADAPKPVRGD